MYVCSICSMLRLIRWFSYFPYETAKLILMKNVYPLQVHKFLGNSDSHVPLRKWQSSEKWSGFAIAWKTLHQMLLFVIVF